MVYLGRYGTYADLLLGITSDARSIFDHAPTLSQSNHPIILLNGVEHNRDMVRSNII